MHKYSPRIVLSLAVLLYNVQLLQCQCNTQAQLSSCGSRCSNYGTAYVSGVADSASEIDWYQNGVLIKTTTRTPYNGNGITVAGGMGQGNAQNQLDVPNCVFVDPQGNIYVSETTNRRTLKFPDTSSAGTYGQYIFGYPDDLGGGNPIGPNTGLWVDCNGSVFIAETASETISLITSVTRTTCFAGDNGAGSAYFQLNYPQGLYVDHGGDIYVADYSNGRVIKFPGWSVNNPSRPPGIDGIVVAGGNGYGSAANQLADPYSICKDLAGNLYVADPANWRIQKFPVGSQSNTNGTTYIGNGQGSGLSQMSPLSICFDEQGYMYASDPINNRVLKFPPNCSPGIPGVVVAGGNDTGSAANQLNYPVGIFVDWLGNLFVADSKNCRVQLFKTNGAIDTSFAIPDSGNITAVVTFPGGCVVNSGVMYVPLAFNSSISVAASADTLCVGENVTFTARAINSGCLPVYQWYVNGVPAGTNSDTFSIRPVKANDTVWASMTVASPYVNNTVVASNRVIVYTDPPVPLTLTQLGPPCLGSDTLSLRGSLAEPGINWALNWHLNGNIFAADIDTVGYISTVVSYTVASPMDLRIGPGDTLYVSNDQFNGIIKYPPNSSQGIYAAGGNGVGSALNQFSVGSGFFFDKSGNLYVSDYFNNRILKFPTGSDSTTRGKIVGGTGKGGSTNYQLYSPHGGVFDAAGNMYIADYLNYRVQKFPPNSDSGTVAITVAGGNGYGDSTDQIGPVDLALDSAGNLFVLDDQNSRVLKFPAGSTSATYGTPVVGGPALGSGSGPGQLYQPVAMLLDTDGSLYISDGGNNRVQKFPPNSVPGTPAVTVAGGIAFGNNGDKDGLDDNQGIGLDSHHNLFVADAVNKRVQEYNSQRIVDSVLIPTMAGQYQAILASAYGCLDSSNIVQVDPNVRDSIIISASSAFCTANGNATFTSSTVNAGTTPSVRWYVNGIERADSSVFTATGLNGNDSVWAVLTGSLVCASPDTATSNGFRMVALITHDTIFAVICTGSSYLFGNENVSVAGAYSDTTINGCDTIWQLYLTVLPHASDTLQVAVCDTGGYYFGNRILHASGFYYDTLQAAGSCDSVVILILTVDTPLYNESEVDICQGDSFYYNGIYYYTSQTFIDTSFKPHGCYNIEQTDLVVYPLPVLNISDTILHGCLNQQLTLNYDDPDGFFYFWSDSSDDYAGIYAIQLEAPYSFTNNSAFSAWLFAIDTNNCESGQAFYVGVDTPPVQPICLVSLDSATGYNMVIWDKANKAATDSFLVYRCITPDSNYSIVGAVPRDSFSVFEDLSSLPGDYSYRYKMAVIDTCGDTGTLSPYHQSIYLQTTGSGNFIWTPYEIEGDTANVSSYAIYLDSLGNGNWQLLGIVNGSQNTFSYPEYSEFPDARYKVVVTLSDPCNPSRSYITITSNILGHLALNVVGVTNSNIRLLYNPVHETAVVINAGAPVTFRLTDNLGRLLQTIKSTGTITGLDLSLYSAGLYYILADGSSYLTTLKVVKY